MDPIGNTEEAAHKEDILKKFSKKFAAALALMLVIVSVSACGGEEKKTLEIGVVNWSDSIAISNLVKVVMEENLGYEVELTMGDAGPIYASVASGDYDVYLDAWLPMTHASYMEKFDGQFDVYSTIFEGALSGLVVPAYMEIDSIEELNSVKDELNGKIVGIDSGAGIMGSTEKAIEAYGLDLELQVGSGPVMTAALADAIESGEAIVVTGWQPHWKFGKWDLKFLEDPKGAFGEPESIKSITRLGLAEDEPEFMAFLDSFKLTSEQLNGIMSMINNSDEDPAVVAAQWVEENPDVVAAWLK